MPLNINGAVDKAFEGNSLKELLDAPVSALQGISDRGADLLGGLGIKTIRDLGTWNLARWAAAIHDLAGAEE